MSVAFVAKTELSVGSSNNFVILSYASSAINNVLFAIVNWGNSSGAASGNVTSVTDSIGHNVWHKIGAGQINTPNTTFGGFAGEVWYAVVGQAGVATATFNLSASFGFQRVASVEYSGIPNDGAGHITIDPNASNPKTNTGSGTALTTGNLTTDVQDFLLLLAFSNSGNTMPASGSFTQRVSGANGSMIQDDLASHSSGSYSFSGTISGSTDWGGFLAGLVLPPASVGANSLMLRGSGL
jgi:hypothetical protein